MSPEDEAGITPLLMEQLLEDPALAIRCAIGSVGERRVVVVFQKTERGGISPVALSKSQISHIHKLAQEHLP